MACGSREGGLFGRRAAGVLGAGLALLALAAPGRAAEIETRDFTVLVGGKPLGEAHMTIHKQDSGQIQMRCDTDVNVTGLVIKYKYVYRGQETWKDGKLVRFESTTDDNGTRYVVSAAAEGKSVRVKVNNAERLVSGDVWLSSYWSLPPARLRGGVVPIVDADTGKDLDSRLTFIATEQRKVGAQVVNLNHYRLTGKVTVDLWYDGSDRLVRQEWLERGIHRTVLELARIRR
jgi:hypothetical protein